MDERNKQGSGATRREFVGRTVGVATAAAIAGIAPLLPETSEAQTQACVVTDPFPQIMEISSGEKGKLQAILRVKNATKKIPGFTGNSAPMMRYFEGQDAAAGSTVWPQDKSACAPGPTLAAKVGDFVEVSFFNEVNVA